MKISTVQQKKRQIKCKHCNSTNLDKNTGYPAAYICLDCRRFSILNKCNSTADDFMRISGHIEEFELFLDNLPDRVCDGFEDYEATEISTAIDKTKKQVSKLFGTFEKQITHFRNPSDMCLECGSEKSIEEFICEKNDDDDVEKLTLICTECVKKEKKTEC